MFTHQTRPLIEISFHLTIYMTHQLTVIFYLVFHATLFKGTRLVCSLSLDVTTRLHSLNCGFGFRYTVTLIVHLKLVFLAALDDCSVQCHRDCDRTYTARFTMMTNIQTSKTDGSVCSILPLLHGRIYELAQTQQALRHCVFPISDDT